MKKSVWIPLLATTCVVAGAVAGAYLIMKKREKELAAAEGAVVCPDICLEDCDCQEPAAECECCCEGPAAEPAPAEPAE